MCGNHLFPARELAGSFQGPPGYRRHLPRFDSPDWLQSGSFECFEIELKASRSSLGVRRIPALKQSASNLSESTFPNLSSLAHRAPSESSIETNAGVPRFRRSTACATTKASPRFLLMSNISSVARSSSLAALRNTTGSDRFVTSLSTWIGAVPDSQSQAV